MVNKLNTIASTAFIPDQIPEYVRAVSGMEPETCDNCLLYRLDSYGVLIAWQDNKPLEGDHLYNLVDKALCSKGLRHFTVLASSIPVQAPSEAQIQKDYWWRLDLPLAKKSPKLENTLRRARRELKVEISADPKSWLEEHSTLVEDFCQLKSDSLDEASRYIFANLKNYLASDADALLFSVKNLSGDLEAFALGDFSPFSTAIYMFAMRKASAAPGASDLALNALIEQAESRGLSSINLGLGINSGIEFFKKKWGATIAFPHVESSWEIKNRGFFSRLFSSKR